MTEGRALGLPDPDATLYRAETKLESFFRSPERGTCAGSGFPGRRRRLPADRPGGPLWEAHEPARRVRCTYEYERTEYAKRTQYPPRRRRVTCYLSRAAAVWASALPTATEQAEQLLCCAVVCCAAVLLPVHLRSTP